MEVWTIVSAVWLSSWVMLMFRTYAIISRMIRTTPGGELIVRFKYLHAGIYAVCIFILTPFIWTIIINDVQRKAWCVTYVAQICRSKK